MCEVCEVWLEVLVVLVLVVVVVVLPPFTQSHQFRSGGNTGPSPLQALATHSAEPLMIFSRFSGAHPHFKSPFSQILYASSLTQAVAHLGTLDTSAAQVGVGVGFLVVVVAEGLPTTHWHQVRSGGKTGPWPLQALATQVAESAMIFSMVLGAQPQSRSPGVQYCLAAPLTQGWAQMGIFFSRASHLSALLCAEARVAKVARATGTRNFILTV